MIISIKVITYLYMYILKYMQKIWMFHQIVNRNYWVGLRRHIDGDLFNNLILFYSEHVFILLEKEMETHFSFLPWRISWTKDPGRLQSRKVIKQN